MHKLHADLQYNTTIDTHFLFSGYYMIESCKPLPGLATARFIWANTQAVKHLPWLGVNLVSACGDSTFRCLPVLKLATNFLR